MKSIVLPNETRNNYKVDVKGVALFVANISNYENIFIAINDVNTPPLELNTGGYFVQPFKCFFVSNQEACTIKILVFETYEEAYLYANFVKPTKTYEINESGLTSNETRLTIPKRSKLIYGLVTLQTSSSSNNRRLLFTIDRGGLKLFTTISDLNITENKTANISIGAEFAVATSLPASNPRSNVAIPYECVLNAGDSISLTIVNFATSDIWEYALRFVEVI